MVDTEKKGLPLWRRILLWLITAAIAAMVLAMVFDYFTGVQIGSEIKKIAAKGEPLTFEAFCKRFANQQADADIYYSEALSNIHPENLRNLKLLDSVYRQSLSISDINKPSGDIGQQVSQVLIGFQSQLNKLDIAADGELASFDIGIDKGSEVMTVQLNRIQTAGILLSTRALYAIDKDNPVKAGESIVSLIKLTRITDVNPVMASYPVKMALTGLACDNMRLLIENCSDIKGVLAKLQSEFSTLISNKGLENMFIAERIRQLELARNVIPAGVVSEYFSKEVPEMKGRIGVPRSKLTMLRIRRKILRYLKDMRLTIEAASKAWPGPLDLIKSDVSTDTDKKAKTLMQSAATFTRLRATMVAMVRSTIFAIAAERYRLDKGRICESSGELVDGYIASVPIDPFSGSSLLYKVFDGGYIVYSVGENGQDDGGSVLSIDKQSAPVDIGMKIKVGQ